MHQRADGQPSGTPLAPTHLTVTFADCNHTVNLPANIDTKYWNDQTVPTTIGSIAACPGCVTPRRPNGQLQQVTQIGAP